MSQQLTIGDLVATETDRLLSHYGWGKLFQYNTVDAVLDDQFYDYAEQLEELARRVAVRLFDQQLPVEVSHSLSEQGDVLSLHVRLRQPEELLPDPFTVSPEHNHFVLLQQAVEELTTCGVEASFQIGQELPAECPILQVKFHPQASEALQCRVATLLFWKYRSLDLLALHKTDDLTFLYQVGALN